MLPLLVCALLPLAPAGEHWSYRPLERPTPPAVRAASWPRNEIDLFVLAELERRGLAPAPDADGRTLARRLAFDLVGLPPTPEEVAALGGAPDDAALARRVEELLGSPHHGERMALWWLDQVRYADTVGYHGDQSWSVHPYRDWVIDAFQRGMRFDRFTLEQLAGDLLEGATLEQRVASCYNRLNRITAEGGSQAEECLAKYAADRVRTTSTVWLGSTLGCAECHDHKYDPFTARDFYAFAAFFADVEERGVYEGAHETGHWPPEIQVPSAEQAAEKERLGAEVARLEREASTPTAETRAGQERWIGATRERLAAREPRDVAWVDDAQENGGRTVGAWRFVSAAGGPVLHGARSRLQEGSAAIVQHYFEGAERAVTLGRGDRFYAWVWIDPDRPPDTVMLQLHAGSWEHRAFWGADAISFGGIGSDTPGHRPHGALPPAGEWARLEVDPAALGLEPGAVVDGMAFTQLGGRAFWDAAGVHCASPIVTFEGLPLDVAEALASDAPSPEESARIAAHYLGSAPELAPARDALAGARAALAGLERAIPTCLVTQSVEPRVVRVLPRGNWMDRSGEEVLPATPRFLPPLRALDGGRADRLDLARWLVARENPLTARAIANRVWRLFFGEGIARDAGDLGSQGARPTHPELLDWLAAGLVESGWDLRWLVRTIVSSRTYRQSSAARPDLAELDPEGRLLAQQARMRLPAELVRDNALAVSGLLAREIGGPSVKPYQPAGFWDHLNFPERTWQHDRGPAQWRRGLYTFWCRTFLHPSLAAFDAPSREECSVARERSSTPLQALVLLDDATFVEAARALAERVLVESGPGVEARVDRAFERVLARDPEPREVDALAELYRASRRDFEARPGAAEALLGVGEAAPLAAVDPLELAAWTEVGRALLNLHETITRP